MNIDVFCPTCGTLFTVRRDVLGKKTKCTNCGNVFVIAEPVAVAAPAPSIAPPLPIPAPFPEFDMSAPAPATRRTARAVAAKSAHPGEFFGFAPEPKGKTPFPALRIVAKLYEVIAILVLIVAAIGFLFFFVGLLGAIVQNPENGLQLIWAAVIASGLQFVFVILMIVSLLFIAQLIRLGLQVEQSTRETRDACRQLADHLCSIERER